MSHKAYMKKSHLHKPMKGNGSYDRAREEEHINMDIQSERAPTEIYVEGYLIDINQVDDEELADLLGRDNGQPENEPLRGEFPQEDIVCMCTRQATFCDCDALDESVVRV